MTGRRAPKYERGASNPVRLIWLLIVVAIVVAGTTALPVFTNYFRLRRATILLANRCLLMAGECDPAIVRTIDEVYDVLDIVIEPGSVHLDVDPDNVVDVSVDVAIPYSFPFVDEVRYYKATFEATARPRADF